MATIDLCTLADVKTELEISSDTSRDSVIESVITGASRAIHRLTEREFKTEAVGSTTRRFELRSLYLDLNPYDISSTSALTVSLHPETATPVSLTATTDFQLQPTTRTTTYQAIRISAETSNLFNSDTARNFGYSLVDVTSASWGFTVVPEDVKRAAVIAVCANLDRRLDAYALAANELVDIEAGIQPQRQPAFSIPMASMVLLNPYRRQVGAF
jgi:hypothetical protein